MIKKFKRVVTKNKLIDYHLSNAFNKDGFVNEDILYTEDRDFFKSAVEVMGDVNASSIFDSVLIAYKEMPYCELELKQLLIMNNKDVKYQTKQKKKYNATDLPPCAYLNPMDVRIYDLIFIEPFNMKVNSKYYETVNTLKRIEDLETVEGYTIVENVREHLIETIESGFMEKNNNLCENDKKYKTLIINDKATSHNTLIDSSTAGVKVVVPNLHRGLYYKINNVLRYPIFTEAYYYNLSKSKQLMFPYKGKTMKGKSAKRYGKSLYEGYFDSGYTLDDNGKTIKIFYIKLFKMKYNAFSFISYNQATELYDLMMNDDNVTDEVKEILTNTYNLFSSDYIANKKEYGHKIPEIKIIERHDYEKTVEFEDDNTLKEVNEFLCSDNGDIELDDEESSDNSYEQQMIKELTLEEQLNEMELESDNIDEKEDEDKPKFSTDIYKLSKNRLKSLLYGYNGVRYYKLYGHCQDDLLKIAAKTTKVNSKTIALETKLVPSTPKFFLVTIASNQELMSSSDHSNPYDIFKLLSYKKTALLSTKSGNIFIADHERYLTEETVKFIDGCTSKSDNCAGLTATLTYWNGVKENILHKNNKE